MANARNSLAVGKRHYRLVPVSALVKATWNYKKDDAELAAKLAANMKRNGQVESLMVRQLKNGTLEVVNGNHRLDALITLGVKTAMVCDLGKISDAEARRLAVETNETRFETDFVKLSLLFKDMNEEFDKDDLLGTLPFDEREISDIEQITEFQWPDKYKQDGERGSKARGKTAPLTFHLTPGEQNAWTNFAARSGKDTPEAALMFAIENK
jgi:hypothetical protein